MTYLISILIPTLIERRDEYNTMIKGLYDQIDKHGLKDKIEIISICDNNAVLIFM